MILRGSFYSQALGRQTNITLVGPDVWPQAGACKTAYVRHGMGRAIRIPGPTTLCCPFMQPKAIPCMYCPTVGGVFTGICPRAPAILLDSSQELPQMVRQRFQVSPIREDTAVLGCSMGGYGALLCAPGCPERFGLCAAFAPACCLCRRSPRPGGFPGAPLLLCRRLGPPSAGRPAPRFWRWHCFPRLDRSSCRFACRAASPAHLACGSRDPFLPDLRRFAAALQALGWAATAEEWRHPRLLLF